MEKRPTFEKLEAILKDETPMSVTTMPSGEVRAETLKDKCDRLRATLREVEQQTRSIKEHPVFTEADAYAGQHGEMIAQSMLAVRHIEGARMRLGKVLQYAGDGVSIYDRA